MATARKGERVLSIKMQIVDGITTVGRRITSVFNTLRLIGVKSFNALLAPLRMVRQAITHLLSPTGLLHTALGILAARGMVRFVQGTAEVGDEVEKLGQRLGLTSHELSVLRFASGQTGSSMSAAANGFKQFSRQVEEASRGLGTARDDFRRLGIAMTDSEGRLRPTMEVFQDVAEIFANMPDGAAKTAASMRMFGKSGTDMIPMLNQGRAGMRDLADQAERLGVVMNDAQSRLSRDFLDALDRTQTALRGIRQQVGFEFFPLLIRQLDGVTSWLVRIRPLLVTAAGAVANIWHGVQDLGQAIARWFTQDAKHNVESIGQAIKQMGEDIRDMLRGVAAAFGSDEFADRARDTLQRIAEVMRTVGFIGGKALIDGMTVAVTHGLEVLGNVASIGVSNLMDRLRRDWIDSEMAFLSWIDRVTGSSSNVLLQRMQRLSDERFKLTMDTPLSMLAEFEKGMSELSSEAWDVLRSSIADVNEEISHLSPYLRELIQVGRDAAAAIGESMDDVARRAREAGEQVRNFASGVSETIEQWWERMRDAHRRAAEYTMRVINTVEGGIDRMFDGIVDGTMKASEAFRNMGREMLKVIAKILAQETAIRSVMWLFPSLRGGAHANGNVMQFARGGVVAAGAAITPFAAGGVVNQPTFFPMSGNRAGLMGEAGPEAIMPLKRNSRGQLGVEADGGMGDVHVHMNVNTTHPTEFAKWLATPESQRAITSVVTQAIGRSRGFRDQFRDL